MAASAARELGILARSSQRTLFRRKPQWPPQIQRRAFRPAAPSFTDDSSPPTTTATTTTTTTIENDQGEQGPVGYEYLSQEEKAQFDEQVRLLDQGMSTPAVAMKLGNFMARMGRELENDSPDFIRPPRVNMSTFWHHLEEPEDMDKIYEEKDFQGDDLSSMGHAELEQHREMRHYARLAAWEMPLLSTTLELSKPFTPPPLTHPLRFRYTTYMGEQHPAEKKVVVEFCTKDIPHLTEPQRIKLIKLAGVRYNPETDIVKMSCEQFPTPAQNKRYLGDVIDSLITEAKDSKDMLEDMPLDFRHHKFVHRPRFPAEWKITPERQQMLDGQRKEFEAAEQSRIDFGNIVDGTEVIREALKRSIPSPQPILVEARAQTGAKKARGRTKKMR
ncbi:MAG: 37S ribosomal protein S24, mitochondrial [Cirrosporium novae-zelandiae]|nr:MAG: 37S ribosomal protein S24, mitochondrial [Cirrosporium novae-zelandiae]